jgi:hypothetical protein
VYTQAAGRAAAQGAASKFSSFLEVFIISRSFDDFLKFLN